MGCNRCLQTATGLSRRWWAVVPRPPPMRRATLATAAAPAADGDSTSAAAGGGEAARPRSSCIAGTVLNGLNYMKGRQDPVALADNEYPTWLWACLDVQKKAAAAEDEREGDEFSKSKKQRRLAAKRHRDFEAQIAATGDFEALAPKIPLQHQSIDLTSKRAGDLNDVFVAADKREELRKAMRKERKAKIKEANYLKSM